VYAHFRRPPGAARLPGPEPAHRIARDGFVNSIAGNVDREATFWFLATGVFFLVLLTFLRAG
jgi:hypothetical protein